MAAPTNSGGAGREPSAAAPTIGALVEREARRLRTLLAAGGASVALAAATLLLALGAALFADARWIALPAALPALLWVLAIGAAAAAGLATWRSLAARGSRGAVAGAIERERALRSGALRGALEVAESGALGRRAADDLARRLSAEGPVLAPALQRDARRRAGGLGAAALVAFLLLVVSATGFDDGWAAVGHPISAWRGTLLPRLGIEVPTEVLRGERATLHIAAPGRRQVTLRSRATGAGWESETYPVRAGRADVVVGPVRAAMTFVATDGRATSDTALVRATDRPFVGDVALRALYPDYLHRQPEPLASGEVARLPRGTVVLIAGRASSALRAIGLAHGTDTVALRPDGHRFDGRMTATASGTWAWSALGVSGPIADLPAPLELDVVPDSAPRVDITSPTRDSVMTPGDRVTIAVVASDDHGLGAVSLRSWRQSESGQVRGEVTDRVASGAGPQWSGTTSLVVGARDLEPGDALHVVAVASDESPWGQRTESRELVLRVPSLSEQRQMARRAADSAVAAATELASAEKALQQRTNEAARARDRATAGGKGSEKSGTDRSASESGGQSGQQGRSAQSPLSYQRAEQARSLSAEQRALSERVKQLQDAAKSLEKQLAQAGALDSGLASRLAEAQRMLRDALTPELQAQLAKLEQAAQGLDGDQARQSLAELAQQQQKLREQLERSAEMLKRAALEGAMQTLRDEARELAQRQRNLADSLGRGDRADASPDRGERDDSAAKSDAEKREGSGREDAKGDESGDRDKGTDSDSQRAKELAQRSRDLSRNVADLEKRLRQEGAQTGAQKADAAQQHAQASADALQKAGQQVGSQQSEGGKESARKAAGEMEKAAQQLAEAREQQVGEWKQELTKELDQSIQEMLQLSRSEEQLAQQTAQGQTSDAQGQQSSIQQGVEKAGQRLQKAGQKSSLLSPRSQRAMGEARQKVQQATKETAQAAQDAAQQSQPGGSQGSQDSREQKQSGQQSSQQPGRQPGGQQQGGDQAGEQPGGGPPQTPGQLQAQSQTMRDAAEALNRAAASLVRDRERANAAKSASGLPEMIEEMNQLAKQQGALNQQAAGLSMMPGGQRGSQAQAGARALGQKQRGLAQSLEGMSEDDASGRTDALAREARQIAEALARGSVDRATLDRQQRLYHRLLEAGKTLEQDERDDTGKREARAATGTETFAPGTDKASGKAASRFREPTWAELRGLSAEERRLVLEYFKRLNAQP